MHRWMLGGLAGGAVGIAIWAAVGYFAQYEIGWIAWGIGFLVGAGVRYGAFLGGEDESEAQGMFAAALAIGSIVTAKYIIFSMLFSGIDTEGLKDFAAKIHLDEEALVANIADEIVEQTIANGGSVEWPEGMSYEEASRQGDYPAIIWQQAEEQWKSLGSQVQQERKREQIEAAAALSELVAATNVSFGDFFSPWDILWFGLAAITAYKIGVGSYGTD